MTALAGWDSIKVPVSTCKVAANEANVASLPISRQFVKNGYGKVKCSDARHSKPEE